MSNGSILPPDIRESMEKNKQSPEASAGGIGGRVAANATTAHQRNVAMGQDPDDDPVVSSTKKEEETQPSICPNAACNLETETTWGYCPKCGTDLVKGGTEKRLGIKLDVDDIQDYLFKGFVVRDLKILGKHSMTVRSSQAKDLREIDDFIINGTWLKDEDGNEKQVSDFMIRQMNALCLTAMAVQKVDGKSIGEDLAARVLWIEEKGSAFVDMMATRVTLFNRALTELLKKEDALLGS